MTIQEKIQSRNYDILEAKKNSQKPTKWFGESVDNSTQYGSKLINAIVDEERKIVAVEDDGRGFQSYEDFVAFHQPYHIPQIMGISRYGIGSKIFKTLSDKRICFSKGHDKETGKLMCYFSYWDTSDHVKTDAPVIECWEYGESEDSTIREITIKYKIYNDFVEFFQSSNTGTVVYLAEVNDDRVKRFCKSWSGMSAKVKDSFFERYHLLLNQKKALSITITFTNNKGVSNKPQKIESFDPRSNIDKSLTPKPLVEIDGFTEIYTWIKGKAQKRLKVRGIHFYRNYIKIATIPFKKKHGKYADQVVDLDPTTSMYRLNTEAQIIMTKNLDDHRFHLGETKDSISLPTEIGLTCADEFSTINRKVTSNRTANNNAKVNKSKTVSISVPSVQMDLSTPHSFVGSNGNWQIVQDSVLYNALNSTNGDPTDIMVAILESFGELWQERTTAQEKKNLTEWMNRVGQFLEQKL
jgi:hypothetical protein